MDQPSAIPSRVHVVGAKCNVNHSCFTIS